MVTAAVLFTDNVVATEACPAFVAAANCLVETFLGPARCRARKLRPAASSSREPSAHMWQCVFRRPAVPARCHTLLLTAESVADESQDASP